MPDDRPRPRLLRRLVGWTFWTLCTLLFVASSAMWVASYWRDVNFHHVPTQQRRVLVVNFKRTDLWPSTIPISVKSNRGQITVIRYSLAPTGPKPEVSLPGLAITHGTWQIPGHDRRIPAGRGTTLGLRIAHGMIATPAGLVCAIGLARGIAWRRRARRPGHCPACGYDIRATPDRCPECGTAAGAT